MLRAIEGHVFEEVSQTLLRVILLDRTHALGNVEVRLLLRGVVVTKVVSQAVVEFSDTDAVVYRNLRHLHLLLLCRYQSGGEQCDCYKKFSKFHFAMI